MAKSASSGVGSGERLDLRAELDQALLVRLPDLREPLADHAAREVHAGAVALVVVVGGHQHAAVLVLREERGLERRIFKIVPAPLIRIVSRVGEYQIVAST